MIKVEATTLEEAYSKASQELECSITELNFEVVQQPSNGFFGIFKKSAVIIATCKVSTKKTQKPRVKKESKKEPLVKGYQKKQQAKEYTTIHHKKQEQVSNNFDIKEPDSGKDIFDNFYSTTSKQKDAPLQDNTKSHQSTTKHTYDVDITNSMLLEIKKELESLIGLTCYNINKIDVKKYNDHTILIDIDGNDAALLIGKDGYRYKAISYMLFNWLNPKYKVSIRLEIAQFLQNQEDTIYNYIDTLHEKIATQSRVQTKPLDGILLHIALNRLRELYPDKYVGVKTKNDKKFVVLNDFN